MAAGAAEVPGSGVPTGNPSGELVGNIEGNRTNGPARLLPGAGIIGPADVPVVGKGVAVDAGAAAAGCAGGSRDEVESG